MPKREFWHFCFLLFKSLISQIMKKGYFIIGILCLTACGKQEVYPPVGGLKKESSVDISKQFNKGKNQKERVFIENWIKDQKSVYYGTSLNYWSSVDFSKRTKREKKHLLSYGYDLFDFNGTQIYNDPLVFTDVIPAKVFEIQAVEDAIYYLNVGEEVTLLVPSSLAYGSFGDQNKIPHDLPLIIKLKLTDIK